MEGTKGFGMAYGISSIKDDLFSFISVYCAKFSLAIAFDQVLRTIDEILLG